MALTDAELQARLASIMGQATLIGDGAHLIGDEPVGIIHGTAVGPEALVGRKKVEPFRDIESDPSIPLCKYLCGLSLEVLEVLAQNHVEARNEYVRRKLGWLAGAALDAAYSVAYAKQTTEYMRGKDPTAVFKTSMRDFSVRTLYPVPTAVQLIELEQPPLRPVVSVA